MVYVSRRRASVSQTQSLVLQMLTAVCSTHKAVWHADFNDWDRDYNASKEKAQNCFFPFIFSLYLCEHAYVHVPRWYLLQD